MWYTYYTPTTIEDTLRLLAEYGGEGRIVAGGTDLLVELERGVRQVGALIDVTRIAGLNEIMLDDEGWFHVGPTVTHNQIVASRQVVERGTHSELLELHGRYAGMWAVQRAAESGADAA